MAKAVAAAASLARRSLPGPRAARFRLFVLSDPGCRGGRLQLRQPDCESLPGRFGGYALQRYLASWSDWLRFCNRSSFRLSGRPTPKPTRGATSGWIRRTFAATMKGTIALNTICVVMLVLFGRSLIRLWAGPAAVPTTALLLAMGIWAVINGFMSVESCLLAALNRTREQAALSIVAAALNIALSVVARPPHRIAGRDRRNDSFLSPRARSPADLDRATRVEA